MKCRVLKKKWKNESVVIGDTGARRVGDRRGWSAEL